MKSDSALTATGAVLRGHVLITLPVLVIIGIVTAIIYIQIGPPTGHEGESALQLLHSLRLPIGGLAGAIAGWIWWSVSVPHWRDWAKAHGADEEQTQKLAVRTLLVWPRGWIFEKTEIHTPKDSE